MLEKPTFILSMGDSLGLFEANFLAMAYEERLSEDYHPVLAFLSTLSSSTTTGFFTDTLFSFGFSSLLLDEETSILELFLDVIYISVLISDSSPEFSSSLFSVFCDSLSSLSVLATGFFSSTLS